MIWWMLALAVLGWAVRRHTGLLVRAPAEHPPDLERLNERLMHVRNVGMRLNELAALEMRLSGEKQQLQSLQKLKLEVEWMLGEVERQMSECAPDSLHPSQAEHLEICWTPLENRFACCSTSGSIPTRPTSTWQRLSNICTSI